MVRLGRNMVRTKNAIITIATGLDYKGILAETIGTMRAYAEKIGADFYPECNWQNGPNEIPHYLKLKLIKNYLDRYERILFIDSDILISPLAPNIFEEVPTDKLGMFNEAPWVMSRHLEDIKSWQTLTGETFKEGTYYNSGVIVASKEHKHFFDLDHKVYHYGEQSALNSSLMKKQAPMYELSHKWNRMSCTFLRGMDPYDSYFIHFAGYPVDEKLPKFIRDRHEEWKSVGYVGGEQIFIVCGGGMGNQICTLPTVQEIMRLYPKAQIGIRSHYPQVFEHLANDRIEVTRIDGKTESEVAEEMKRLDQKYQFARVIATYKEMPMDMTQMNSVDFHSLCALGRQLPEPRIEFPATANFPDLPPNTICIHAGKNGWKSKDIPKEYYQEIADKLKAMGFKIAIIGKEEFTEHGQGYGAYRLSNIDFDFLNISLSASLAAIQKSIFLLSNDSAPVHLAGASNTPIGIISIAKHPSLIAPKREHQRHIGFAAGRGQNLWDIAPPKPYYFPFERHVLVADWVDGMQWPNIDAMIEYIRKICAGTLP